MDIKKLIASMTLRQKLAGLTQLNASFFREDSGADATGPMAEMGIDRDDLAACGSTLNFRGADVAKEMQSRHLSQDPSRVPMLFMMDVVHGFRTIYPIPLGLASSFDPRLVRECCQMAAREAKYGGVQVTFAPMVDLARDARWGRVMETTGEDPYLNSLYSAASVEGFQSEGIAACVKHFAAYGAAEAGRDYNTVDMSSRHLHEYYLPAYKAAVDAGVKMVMTSFNILDGVPAASNERLVSEVLRKQWGFDGVVISDYNAFREFMTHGVAEDETQAALLAIKATNDVEMMSPTYLKCMEKLIADGAVSEAEIDAALERFLRLKADLGAFENPYFDTDKGREDEICLSESHREICRRAAEQSAVLLKNDGILPLSTSAKKVAVIGPFADSGDILGFWRCHGEGKDTVTVASGVRSLLENATVTVAKGVDGALDSLDESGIAAAAKVAAKADAVILTLGEPQGDSGEGNSKLDLDLPEIQYKLLDAVVKANPHVAVLLFTGRPLAVPRLIKTAPAVLLVWQPGTEGGSAAANLLFGKTNPSGKLTMSFPYATGQCPIYYNHYNTGRPRGNDKVRVPYVSGYIDGPNAPLFPFGYGMSYTSFEYSPLRLSENTMRSGGKITAAVTVKNTGKRDGVETVQLYIRDLVGSCVRPVRELKGFKKIALAPGEEKQVEFEITEDMLAYYGADLVKRAESGAFAAFIGGSSDTQNCAEFRLD